MTRLFTLICYWLLTTTSLQAQTTGTPTVGLEDGSVIEGTEVRLRTPPLTKPFLQVNRDQKYALDQVAYYQNHEGYFLKKNFKGKDQFLKRQIVGKRLNTYSKEYMIAGSSYGAGGTYMPTGPRKNTSEFYQKDGGEVKLMNFTNLKMDLSDHPGSAQKLKEVKTIRLIHGLTYLAAAGLLIADFADTDVDPENTSTVTPLFVAGAVLIAIPLATGGSKKRKMWEAVQMYNQ